MHSTPLTAKIRLFAVAAVAAAGFALLPSAAWAGTTDNVSNWAWSGTIGWISMNCTNLSTCGTADYGVTLTDVVGSPGVANLSGWAWSETVGWICFGATCSGTTPEGTVPTAQFRATSGGKVNQFWGWAQVTAFGTSGWVALNCDKDVGTDECATSNYFVSLNPATGAFNNGTLNDHFGWGGNGDGTGIGWVDMSLVTTSWNLSTLGTVVRPGSIFEPQDLGGACVSDANCVVAPYLACNTGISKCVRPGTHVSSIPIKVQGYSAPGASLLRCDITLPDGSLLSPPLTKTVVSRASSVTDTLTYTLKTTDQFDPNKLWTLSRCLIGGPVKVTACASIATEKTVCGATAVCDLTAGKCRDILATTSSTLPLFTHPNAWTGTSASGQDEYQAIKCNAGFPGSYFSNPGQCDFTSDVTYSLLMRRGAPVEICDDGVDNDGNGLTDCADPACRRVSGFVNRCTGPIPTTQPTPPRTTCIPSGASTVPKLCTDATWTAGQLCCSAQPTASGSAQDSIVDGLECSYGDPNDGYFDCDCAVAKYGTGDCYAPGAASGTLCCSTGSVVTKQP